MVMKQRQSRIWETFEKTLTGASHRRTNRPNQDAILGRVSKGGKEIILAVSDGHGSSASFRSNIGSDLAVKTAVEFLERDLLQDLRALEQAAFNPDKPKGRRDSKMIDEIAELQVPKRLVSRWKEKVDKHWKENAPPSEKQWKDLEAQGVSRREIENKCAIAYGATLLAVLITESFIFYFQLGDGDILCVDAEGSISRPIERDPSLIANETTSLCTSDAWEKLRIKVDKQPEQFPQLILLATDGYANSYPSDQEFLQIGLDYLQMIKSQGASYVRDNLYRFLEETSREGSGDDITLGIAFQQMKRMNQHQRNSNQNPPRPMNDHQKKNNRTLSFAIRSLIATLLITLLSLGLNLWLWVQMKSVHQELKTLQQELEGLKAKGNPQNGAIQGASNEIPQTTIPPTVIPSDN